MGDEGYHEGHRQKANLQVIHAVELGRGTGDGSKADPQHLDGQVDEQENGQYHPAIAVQLVEFFCRRFALGYNPCHIRPGSCHPARRNSWIEPFTVHP